MLRLLSVIKTYSHELFQLCILALAVVLFYTLSKPAEVRVETKVVTELKEVKVYVDRVVVKEVEKIVYRDRTTTKTVTRPSGVTTTTVTVDKGTVESIEKELESEERVEETKVLSQIAEYKYEGGSKTRWSLGTTYDLRFVNKFDISKLGLEVGLRLANLPLWSTLRVEDLGRTYKTGLRFEF